MMFREVIRQLPLMLVLVAALSVFGACGRMIGEAPIQSVISAALDHTVETLVTGDSTYRSRKLVIDRSSGADLRTAAATTTPFEYHHEAVYERVLPDGEQVTVTTWREYPGEPGVRYPAECESTVVVGLANSFDEICDGVWIIRRSKQEIGVTNGDVLPTDVEFDLRTTVNVDALTRVENGEYRRQAMAVYEGFNSARGQLRHITFMVGLEDGIIHHAYLSSSTRIIEWEHWDIGALDMVIEAPPL